MSPFIIGLIVVVVVAVIFGGLFRANRSSNGRRDANCDGDSGGSDGGDGGDGGNGGNGD